MSETHYNLQDDISKSENVSLTKENLSNTRRILAQMYVDRRLEQRYSDYKTQIHTLDSYNNNASTLVIILALVLALLTGFNVLLSGTSVEAVLTAIIIILAGIIFYIISLRGLYQWDRHYNLYKRARISLEDARSKIPETLSINSEKVEYAISELVTTAEDVIKQEMSERITHKAKELPQDEISRSNDFVPKDLALVSHLIVKEGTVRTTAFISYRRKGSWLHARKLHSDLALIGVDAFMDYEDLTEGNFEDNLNTALHTREHLIAILVPGTLDSEWVKIEIRTAMSLGKNIVPLLADGFQFPPVMPEGLEDLSKQNAITLSQEYYGASMAKLARFLKLE